MLIMMLFNGVVDIFFKEPDPFSNKVKPGFDLDFDIVCRYRAVNINRFSSSIDMYSLGPTVPIRNKKINGVVSNSDPIPVFRKDPDSDQVFLQSRIRHNS